MGIEVRGRDNIVPIDMRVKVDDRWEVSYERCKDEFAFEFKVFPKNDAYMAVEEIVSAMEVQSYDHGAEWRRISIEDLNKSDEDDMYRFFKAKFRIRDIW